MGHVPIFPFTGHEFDIDTGLYYQSARYYEGSRGQFISQDRMFIEVGFDLSDPQSMNSYAYARNNPIIYVDQYGNAFSLSSALQNAGGFAKGFLWNGPIDAAKSLYRTAQRYSGPMGPLNATLDSYQLYQTGVYIRDNPKEFAGYVKESFVNDYRTFEVVSPMKQGEQVGELAFNIFAVLAPFSKGSGIKALDGSKFFEGTQYSTKVQGQMQNTDDLYHAFPELVKEGAANGQVKVLRGNDGLKYQQLNIPGSINGQNGAYEFIKDSNGVINHRQFVPSK